MILGKEEDKKVEVLKIPYRKHTLEERQTYLKYANQFGIASEAYYSFWRQTEEEAKKLIDKISSESGFKVGGNFYWDLGFYSGILGNARIYPRNYQGQVDISKDCDNENAIGSIMTWEECGFIQPPVAVLYSADNLDLVGHSLQLRDYLIGAEIDFYDSADLKKSTPEVISVLEGIKLIHPTSS